MYFLNSQSTNLLGFSFLTLGLYFQAKEDSEVLRSLLVPLEEEIELLKDKLREMDQEVNKYKSELSCANQELTKYKGENVSTLFHCLQQNFFHSISVA